MPAYLSPVGNSAQIDSNGKPLSGGTIETYLAGTSTAGPTYTDSTGSTPQANPITLNANGLPASPIWIAGGTSLKFVIKDSAGVTLRTIDGVSGVNDPAFVSTQDQWVALGLKPTYASATTFTVPGDKTNTLQVGRRLRTQNTGGTIYSTITQSSFSGSGTTVTVANDVGTLDSGLSAVYYGLLSIAGSALPRGPAFRAVANANQALVSGTPDKATFATETTDTGGYFASSTYTPKVAGDYAVGAVVRVSATNGTSYYCAIYKNGVEFSRGDELVIPANNNTQQVSVNDIVPMNGSTDYVEIYACVTGTTPSLIFTSSTATSRFYGTLVRLI